MSARAAKRKLGSWPKTFPGAAWSSVAAQGSRDAQGESGPATQKHRPKGPEVPIGRSQSGPSRPQVAQPQKCIENYRDTASHKEDSSSFPDKLAETTAFRSSSNSRWQTSPLPGLVVAERARSRFARTRCTQDHSIRVPVLWTHYCRRLHAGGAGTRGLHRATRTKNPPEGPQGPGGPLTAGRRRRSTAGRTAGSPWVAGWPGGRKSLISEGTFATRVPQQFPPFSIRRKA